MQSKADIKRQLILETAKTLVLADGFNSLTLEAVAKKAGISKGGLLYHFPNKEKLIAWLGEYIFQEFENNFSKIADSDPRKEEYANCFTISDKARCIAGSVLELVCAQYMRKMNGVSADEDGI